jgi:hypothetical protein
MASLGPTSEFICSNRNEHFAARLNHGKFHGESLVLHADGTARRRVKQLSLRGGLIFAQGFGLNLYGRLTMNVISPGRMRAGEQRA